MCDKINKEFWKCLEKNKYLDISKCAKLQKKELDCLFNLKSSTHTPTGVATVGSQDLHCNHALMFFYF